MGGWRDSTQTLAKRPPTPPVEPWDCDIQEETHTEEDAEEEEENWDTEDELSWDNLATCLLYTSPSPRD